MTPLTNVSPRLLPTCLTRDQANAWIKLHHRHHGAVSGHRFIVGAVVAGELVGVAVAGRPRAKAIQQYENLEVNRLCSDGARNVCSFLYSRVSRVAAELGFATCFTAILKSESGASLRAAGWLFAYETKGGSQDRPSRPRVDKSPTEPKQIWAAHWCLEAVRALNVEQAQRTTREWVAPNVKAHVLRAPFPYFGGKSRVADVVWRAFGPDVPNYIEPFCGSLAVTLARPGGAGKIETVNDRDRYVANVWRAIIADPWGVAEWCDSPVNEADLHARHLWLVNQHEFRERMHTDPEYYDVKIAGWWLWGICCWIGGGWCVEPNATNGKHPKLDGIGKGVHSDAGHGKARNLRTKTRPRMSGDNAGEGVHSAAARTRGAERVGEANRPELAGVGKGINSETAHQRKRPSLDGTHIGRGVHSEDGQLPAGALRGRPRPNLNSGQGVHAAAAGMADAYSPGRPALSTAGGGVHMPSLGNDRGIHGVSATPGTFLHALRELSVPDAPPCFEWFQVLMLRLRRVRVACGDWQRVLGDSVLGKGKNVGGRRPCGIFFDPPYAHELRDPYLYSEDAPEISALVRVWAIDHGDDPDLRIALCGYAGEHEMPPGWTEYAWKGARGYAAATNTNRDLERIWFSRHCLPLTAAQGSLFT